MVAATPTGPCWAPITLTKPTSALPPGSADGDHLVWINGAWVTIPEGSHTGGPDTIFGYIVPPSVTSPGGLTATQSNLDKKAGYYNRDLNIVFIYDTVTSAWVIHTAEVGDEFVDIDTGDVYALVTSGAVVAGTAFNGNRLSFTATIGDGASTNYEIRHNLRTKNVKISIVDLVSNKKAPRSVRGYSVDENTVFIDYPSPPANSSQRVVITKATS